MEIERINENTVKFYISYVDIENRGFEREEIWYNRERSEQLFWQMMDEVNNKEDFTIEGPLWIQVQALEKGLEIIVTKAQLSKNGILPEMGEGFNASVDITIGDKINKVFGENVYKNDEYDDEDDVLWLTVSFESLEDAIQLSHYINNEYEKDLTTAFYFYKEQYYLYVELSSHLYDYQEDVLSQIFEYSTESDITHHVLDEYGKVIFEEEAFENLRKYFQA